MKTLTTQKIVLGLLITLVLAFGMQDTADALSFRESRTGDLQTIVVSNEFTVSLSVVLGSNTTPIRNDDGDLVDDSDPAVVIDSSGYAINDNGHRNSSEASGLTGTFFTDTTGTNSTSAPFFVVGGSNVSGSTPTEGNVVNSDGDTVYIQTGTSPNFTYPRARAIPDERVSNAKRYHFNQEAIAIAVPDGTTLTKIGNYRVNVTGGAAVTHPMNELASSTNEDKLTSSLRLTFNADAVGEKIITISDTTPEADRPGNASPPLSFTIFVVPALDNSTALTLQGAGTDGYETRNDNADPRIDNLFGGTAVFGATDNVPLVYRVDEGSGSLYVKETYADGSPTSQSSSTRTLSTSSQAMVYLDMRGSSNKVTAYVRDRNAAETSKTITFIFNYAEIEIISGNDQTGVPNSRLIDPLGIKVKDAKGRALSGLAVTFTPADGATLKPVIGTDVYLTSGSAWAAAFANIDRTKAATATVPAAIAVDTPAMVPTDRSGEAQVYLELGSAGAKTVTVMAGGSTKTFNLTSAETTDIPSIEILSGNNQRSESDGKVTDPLVVRVLASNNQPLPTQLVTFTTTKGYLTTLAAYQNDTLTPATINGPATQVTARTDLNGETAVSYDLVEHSGASDVIAVISGTSPTYSRRVTFNINGSGTPARDDADDAAEDTAPDTSPTLTVSPTTITGRPGSTQSISITASQTAQVGNFFDSFLEAGGSVSPTSSSGTFTATLTLPSTEQTYTLTVSMAGISRTVSVTVDSTAVDTATSGTVSIGIQPGSGAPGTRATVTVRATDDDGDPAANVSVTLSITAGGGTFSPATVTTDTNGVATSTLTFGSTPGSNYFIRATVPSGYTFDAPASGERVTITGTPSPGDTSQPREAGEPDSIDVYDGDGQRGVPNVRLADPLVVEVVDANDTPVSNVRVRFRTTIGSGQFSPTLVRTNQNGRAQTRFTPTSSGRIRIAASVNGITARAVFNITVGEAPASLTKVSGDNQSGTPDSALANPFVVEVKDEDGDVIEGVRVTFSVTAGGGRLSDTSATTDEDGHAESTLTLGSRAGINSVQASVPGVDPVTFSTSIEPEILVAAANRPAMYWIDSGALYGLTGAKTTKIAEGANGIAVGGGKVYWTAATGESSGTINAANLDGSNPETLTTIMAVPIGIAVDTAGSKLYWTNSRGRIQSANLNGSGIRNVLQNLSNPTDIVVSNNFIYWTEDGNTIRRVNISGQKVTRDVAANLDTVGGLAIGGGKVYWTEMTGASAGTVNGADLDGTQFKTLATLLAAPMGISVDTVGSKLYWTNSRGRVQSANLDGSGIRNVVTGLISPSKLVTGGANTAETVTQKPMQPAKKDTSAYDVNGDGKVNNVDASLVASGLDTGDAKYDVNKDGTVNFLDLLLVFDNRDDDAAGAPTVVGMKLTAVQVDILQEQIDLLIATGDRSPAAMRTLIYLQQLIATARPEKTQLFANYPNPFNPETWIPYELATDTTVKITIYNTQGVVIRTLELGHQSAGYYTGRDRAAYWDGQNALGEQVASGIYFYQFETDGMSSMRKMVILK